MRLSREGATTIIYDSDEFQVPNNSRRTLVIHDNVGPDNNTLGSFQLTDAGLSPFQNAAARSSLFVVNAVADETNIVAGVTDTGTNTALVSQTLNFTDTIPFTNYDSGFLNVTANVASNPTNQVSTTISFRTGYIPHCGSWRLRVNRKRGDYSRLNHQHTTYCNAH